MLTFGLVVSRSGHRIPEPVLERLRDRTYAEVPFDAGSHLLWSNESGTVFFGGWQDTSDVSSAAHHWFTDDDGLTAFAGHVWPRRDGWRGTGPWAAQLAEHLRSTPLSEGTEDLAGIYVAAWLGRRGRGAVAADPLGVGLVYWGQGRDVIVISSRAAVAANLLAAESATEPKRDAVGAGWLAFSVYAMGLQTGFEHVTVVPAGTVIDIGPTGGARLLPASRPPWRPSAPWSPMPTDALEEVRGEVTTAIRMALAMPATKLCAGLTGGKDTRLILAILLAEGLASEVEFQTFGQPDLPDVVVAQQIAEAFALRHVLNPGVGDLWAWKQMRDAALREAGHGGVSSREAELRITAWVASGSRNVGDLLTGRPPRRDRVLLSGGSAEVLRVCYPATARFDSKQEVSTLPSSLKWGTAGILRPEALEHYRREIHRLLFDGCLEADSPQDVVDAFYIRNELRRWLGTPLEMDSENRVFPLYSMTAVRLAFAIGGDSRHAEWIHYQLMRGACEQLVMMDFSDGGWSPGAASGLAPPPRHCEPAPEAPPTTSDVGPLRPRDKAEGRTLARDRRAQLEASDLDIMRRLLRHDPSNPVFDIIDPVATEQVLADFRGLFERQQMQVYGALTAAIWLGGHELALPRQAAWAAG